jgi:hypothetical protein
MYACRDCIGEHTISAPLVAYSPLLCARHRELRGQEGTCWMPPGQGSSVADLLDASGEGSTSPAERRVMTELLLTGRTLSKRDLGRISDVLAWARAGREAAK